MLDSPFLCVRLPPLPPSDPCSSLPLSGQGVEKMENVRSPWATKWGSPLHPPPLVLSVPSQRQISHLPVFWYELGFGVASLLPYGILCQLLLINILVYKKILKDCTECLPSYRSRKCFLMTSNSASLLSSTMKGQCSPKLNILLPISAPQS